GHDPPALGSPPESSGPAHLLRRYELREAPGDLRIVFTDQAEGLSASEVEDIERAVRGEGHAAAGRVRARVEARAGREPTSAARGEIARVDPPPKGEGRDRESG